MRKLGNQTIRLMIASGLLVIVVVLTVVAQPNKNPGHGGRFIDFGMMDQSGGVMALDRAEVATSMGYAGESTMWDDSYKSYMPIPEPITGGQTAAEAEQRIIKTADLAISVDGVEGQTYAIISLATGRGGFVQASTLVEDEDGYKSGYLTVRVPSATFEDTIEAIKDLAVRVDRESINGQDVTEQYTDLEARLRSALAQEEQYLEILDQAQTVQDILAVQSYLQTIRYEIESLQGQIDSLGNQTEYSTISITITEEVRVQIPAEKFDLVRDVKLAFKYVVVLAQTLLTYLVWFIIVGGAVVVPLGLFVGLMVWVIRKIVARF